MGRTEGSGQGSIYKRGDKWRGQISIGGQRRSFTSAKKKDVIDWIAKQRLDPDAVDQSNITVKELCETWLEKEKEPVLSPQVYYQLEKSMAKYLYPAFGDRKVQSLTRDDIEKFYQITPLGKMAAATVTNFERRFKELLNYAVKENIIVKSPHEYAIVSKSKDTHKVEAYTVEEQEKITKYLKENISDPACCIFYLMLATGMRVSEAAALEWSDIDLKTGAININKIVVRYSGHTFIQNHPKTASSLRTVYMSKRALRTLKTYKRYTNEKEGKLFATKGGSWQTASNLRHRWSKICAIIGVPYRGTHSLRHTFATRALEKGIDIKTVSTILGHKSVVITMNIYQDVYSDHKINAMKIMDDLF